MARERGEKPNRTKTAPKQTEKRGKRAGEKRDNRKLSQRVSVFFRGAGWLGNCRAAALGAPGPVPSPWPGGIVRGGEKEPVTRDRKENPPVNWWYAQGAVAK